MEISITIIRGQIVVPGKFRAKYGIKPGTGVTFIEKNGDLVLKVLNKDYFDLLAGWLPEKGDPLSVLLKEKQNEKKR